MLARNAGSGRPGVFNFKSTVERSSRGAFAILIAEPEQIICSDGPGITRRNGIRLRWASVNGVRILLVAPAAYVAAVADALANPASARGRALRARLEDVRDSGVLGAVMGYNLYGL